jgi:hypothetical protein
MLCTWDGVTAASNILKAMISPIFENFAVVLRKNVDAELQIVRMGDDDYNTDSWRGYRCSCAATVCGITCDAKNSISLNHAISVDERLNVMMTTVTFTNDRLMNVHFMEGMDQLETVGEIADLAMPLYIINVVKKDPFGIIFVLTLLRKMSTTFGSDTFS